MSGPVIVASKLRPPTLRLGAVLRTELVERLARRVGGLSVIVAPTGWGKSQLIAQWLANSSSPVAYVALDRSDNDSTRCLAHMLASIARAVPIEVSDLTASLRAPGLALLSEIVEPLVARLTTLELTIVIEDFHVITSPEVIESVEALIDLAPPHVAIAIVTRTEPPIHLPRRRVSDELSEIRIDDLRMGTTEAGRVITAAIGHALDDESVRLLVDRTEGWPAGLYLAGLTLRGVDDARRFIASFAGDDRMISDYLSTEVLAGLDPEDRRFLLGTAVLTRLDADICDQLLGTTDSAARLDHLRRTNLFLIPTDSAGRTYRYHHLFGDWLQLEARRDDPDEFNRAHRRAAEIYSVRDEHVLAVDHALAAGAVDLAYALVARSGFGLADTGHHSTVARWCSQLPETDDVDQVVDLLALRAWLGVFDGDLDAVDRHCRTADKLLQLKPWKSTFGIGEAGDIDLIRSYGLLLSGHFHAAVAAAAAARSAGFTRSFEPALCFVEAATGYWLGDADEDHFLTARSISLRVRRPFAVLLADGYLALVALDNRDLASARRLTDAAFATAHAEGLESFGYTAICHLARAQIRLLDGDARGALADGQRAAELALRRSDRPIGCLAGIVIVNARHDLGLGENSETLASVIADLMSLPDPGILDEKLKVTERQLRLPVRDRVHRSDVLVEELTEREIRLLRLLPGSLSQRELGDVLHISFNTVKTYNRQIYRKLGVSSRDDAVAAAQALGLL